MLDILIKAGWVKIYLLNRRSKENALAALGKIFLAKGLDPKVLDNPLIEYLLVDFSREDLRLENDVYCDVSSLFCSVPFT